MKLADIKEMVYYAKHGTGYKPESNEDLVDLIQITKKKCYWDRLYEKTEDLIHYVFHKKINNDFYKNSIKDDIYSILRTGWVHAVNKYDRTKCANFHPFASFIMKQHFIMFARRITPEKNGVSVRYELLDSVESQTKNHSLNGRDKEGCVTSIMKDESFSKEINDFELREYMMDKIEQLRDNEPLSADLIYKHFFCGKTQKSLCEEYGLNQSTISRRIKAGYNFLKSIINRNELAFY